MNKPKLSEAQMDALVERIKAPIGDLESDDAELLMLHAAFEVSCYVGASMARNVESQKAHLLAMFEQFLKGNPSVIRMLNKESSPQGPTH